MRSGDADGEDSEVTTGQMGVARSTKTGDGNEKEHEGGGGKEPAVGRGTEVTSVSYYFHTLANQSIVSVMCKGTTLLYNTLSLKVTLVVIS